MKKSVSLSRHTPTTISRDYRIIAEYVSDFKKASPLANKMGTKLVERILDAAPGRPALYDELVKKDFSH